MSAKKKKINKKRFRRAITTVFAILFAVIGIILSLTVFFPIKEVRVEGQFSLYTEQEIMAASGIEVGGNLFRFNAGARANDVWTSLPYLESVHIRRTLAGTVVIEVAEVRHLFALRVDDQYAVVSEGLKVLQLTDQLPDNAITVLGIEITQAKMGKILETNTPNEVTFFTDLVGLMGKYQMLDGVNEIDLSDRLNGSLLYENRFIVMFGTVHDLEYKVEMLRTMVFEKLRPTDMGYIDVSMVATTSRGYFDSKDIFADVENPDK